MSLMEVEKRQQDGSQKTASSVDENDDLDGPFGRPIVIPLNPKPATRPRPSYITNREFVPSLFVYVGFASLVFIVERLHASWPSLGLAVALIVLMVMGEWERRARYLLGRVRQRIYFDPLSKLKLPIVRPRPDVEMEPLTPWIPQNEETVRSNPADIVKRAQETIGSETSTASDGGEVSSSMTLALISLLQKGALEEKEKLNDKAVAEQPPPS